MASHVTTMASTINMIFTSSDDYGGVRIHGTGKVKYGRDNENKELEHLAPTLIGAKKRSILIYSYFDAISKF